MVVLGGLTANSEESMADAGVGDKA
jgi:hypothetical protein